MKQIQLVNGRGAALVDDDDFEWLSKSKWYLTPQGYATRRGSMLMHRMVMRADKLKVVDHIDHNPLNNQKSNLRVCSQRDNMMNVMRAHADAESSMKGVWVQKRYVAEYRGNYVGIYNSERDAAAAYDLCALRDQGLHARLNFPIEVPDWFKASRAFIEFGGVR